MILESQFSMIKGQVIGGDFSKVIVRQKSDSNIELGELLIADSGYDKTLFKVVDLGFASQLSKQNLELISGMFLEEKADLEFMDADLRNYKLAVMKSVLYLKGNDAMTSKVLPNFFSTVRSVDKEDLSFFSTPEKPLFLGKLRSGSSVLDFDIHLDGSKVLSEHILVAATTGRGKSNLTKCILWGCVEQDYCSTLVLDPHDEYFGRTSLGLKDHPSAKEKVIYYTPKNPPPGARTLKINLELLSPRHFDGAISWSDPQKDALYGYYKKFGKKWIEAIILEKALDQKYNEMTLGVVRRKIMGLLDLDYSNDYLSCKGVFDLVSGSTTITDIIEDLSKAKTVIIDTSGFSGATEILIGSVIASEVLSKHKRYKTEGTLDSMPVVSIVLEEAPRVLGKEVLESGPNVFSSIAREGRKFKVGLYAITQLPSLIPRQILANMNTKIILGIEMAPERQAIIESASQDLSDDSRMIASLDKGEAVVTSNFARFALPLKIPLFKRVVTESQNEANRKKHSEKKSFSGVNLSG